MLLTEERDLYRYTDGHGEVQEAESITILPDDTMLESLKMEFVRLWGDSLAAKGADFGEETNKSLSAVRPELLRIIADLPVEPILRTSHLFRILVDNLFSPKIQDLRTISEEVQREILILFLGAGGSEKTLPAALPLLLEYLQFLPSYVTQECSESTGSLSTHKLIPEPLAKALNEAIPRLRITDYFRTLDAVLRSYPLELIPFQIVQSLFGSEFFPKYIDSCQDLPFCVELIEHFILTFPGAPLCISPRKVAQILVFISESKYSQIPDFTRNMAAVITCGMETKEEIADVVVILEAGTGKKLREISTIPTLPVFKAHRFRVHERNGETLTDTTPNERKAGLFQEVLRWLPREVGAELWGLFHTTELPEECRSGYIALNGVEHLSDQYVRRTLHEFELIFGGLGRHIIKKIAVYAKNELIRNTACDFLTREEGLEVADEFLEYYLELQNSIEGVQRKISAKKDEIKKLQDDLSALELQAAQLESISSVGTLQQQERSEGISRNIEYMRIRIGREQELLLPMEEEMGSHEKKYNDPDALFRFRRFLISLESQFPENAESGDPGFLSMVFQMATSDQGEYRLSQYSRVVSVIVEARNNQRAES